MAIPFGSDIDLNNNKILNANTNTPTANENLANKKYVDDKACKIPLTGQLQISSYRRSVIALCKVSTTDKTNLDSYSSGDVYFHRTNGLEGMNWIRFSIENQYNKAFYFNFNYLSNLTLNTSTEAATGVGFRPCTFKYNDEYYGGIEVFIANAELSVIEFIGSTNFGIFGLDYYRLDYNDNMNPIIMNQEVYDSLNYTQHIINKQQLYGIKVDAIPTGDTLPIGSVMEWYSDSIPSNWLLCNGQAVSRTEYAELFAVLGTKYGEGDGSTTFNLPDRRGVGAIGKDENDSDFNTLGKKGGSKKKTLVLANMPAHTHKFTGTAHTHTLNGHTHTYAKSNTPTGAASGNTGSTTLKVSQIPSHAHKGLYWNGNIISLNTLSASGYGLPWNNKSNTDETSFSTGNTGGGSGHTHTLNSHTHTISTTSTNTGANSGNTSSTTATGTNETVGEGTEFDVMNPHIVVNYIIKAKQSAGLVADVVDNLNSDSTTDALSAKQGKVLKEMINNIPAGTTSIVDVDSLPEITDDNRNQIIRYNGKLYSVSNTYTGTAQDLSVGADLSSAKLILSFPDNLYASGYSGIGNLTFVTTEGSAISSYNGSSNNYMCCISVGTHGLYGSQLYSARTDTGEVFTNMVSYIMPSNAGKITELKDLSAVLDTGFYANLANYIKYIPATEAWVCINEGVAVSNTEPTGDEVVWINPDEDEIEADSVVCNRNIITASTHDYITVTAHETYTLLPLSADIIVGDKLAITEEGDIKVLDDISTILISASLSINAKTNRNIHMRIIKNRFQVDDGTDTLAWVYGYCTGNEDSTLVISNTLANVSKGDTISIYYYCSSGDVIYGNSYGKRTHLTVEVIE